MKCPHDTLRNQFPRRLDGTFEDVDLFIDCYNNIQISYYGKGILQAYIPNLKRGNNIIKEIQNNYKDYIFDIEKTDTEVLFKFHSKYMKDLEMYLKPKTSGASISPYSNKNLPKDKSYCVPEDDLKRYKEIIKNISKESVIIVGQCTNNFLKSLTNKKYTWEDIKSDMAVKGLRGKEYIHCIGQWDNYLNYLRKELTDNE